MSRHCFDQRCRRHRLLELRSWLDLTLNSYVDGAAARWFYAPDDDCRAAVALRLPASGRHGTLRCCGAATTAAVTRSTVSFRRRRRQQGRNARVNAHGVTTHQELQERAVGSCDSAYPERH